VPRSPTRAHPARSERSRTSADRVAATIARIWKSSKAVVKAIPVLGGTVAMAAHLRRQDRSFLDVPSRIKVVALYLAPWLASKETHLRLSDGTKLSLRWHSSDREVFTQTLVDRHYDLPYGLDDCRLVIDAGANIGTSTLFFANLYPLARVVAIEPDPTTYRYLEANTAANPRIACVRAALWPRDEPIELHDPGVGPWGIRVIPAVDGETVPVVTVGEVLASYGNIDGAVLLKLDIEGAEREVLSASGDWIGSIGAIAVELHETLSEGATAALRQATLDFRRCASRAEISMVSRV
jgi:FkbM family methyltransferase